MNSAKEYIAYDINPTTRSIVAAHAEAGNVEALENCMEPRIAFGTAGLRALMRPGYAYINDLVVLQTAQGLCSYYSSGSVVIGFDHRSACAFDISSRKLANLCATVFLEHGFKVFLFATYVPTPLVAFSVAKLHCKFGIMITASHNPKDYTGLKIYNSTGSLLTSPYDQEICRHILRNLTPRKFKNPDLLVNPFINEDCHDPSECIIAEYLKTIECLASKFPKNLVQAVYTPMHGVALPLLLRAFEVAHLEAPTVVCQQALADPEFPTVLFPNPEEDSALFLAIRQAERLNYSLVLANDPDGDRFACAELVNGKWHMFTGNELGLLLCDFLCPKTLCIALNTLVSSQMLTAWAQKRGNVEIVQTLTGFKYIGNKTRELLDAGKNVFFAYEEAIGFMCDPINVTDKDGITAAVCMTLLAGQKSPYTRLLELYLEIGYFKQSNGYVSTLNKPSDCGQRCVDNMRKSMKTLGRFSITAKPEKEMFQFIVKIDSSQFGPCNVSLRPSGTEPKLKYYIEVQAMGDNIAEMDRLASGVVQEIQSQLINEINKFI